MHEDLLLSVIENLTGSGEVQSAVIRQIVQSVPQEKLIAYIIANFGASPVPKLLLTGGVDMKTLMEAMIADGKFNQQLFVHLYNSWDFVESADRDILAAHAIDLVTDRSALVDIVNAIRSESVARHILASQLASPANDSDDLEIARVMYACVSCLNDIQERQQAVHALASKSSVPKIELNIQFYQLIGNQLLVPFESLLINLTAADRHSRRSAKWLITQTIGDGCDKCSWTQFWQLYDSVDEYSCHLFKSIFVGISNLKFCPIDSSCHLSRALVRTLLHRCLTHENHHVVKYAITTISSDKSVENFLIKNDILDLNLFLEAIEKTPSVFQGKVEGERISAFIGNVLVAAHDRIAPFLQYVLCDAKLYYPIVHCYLTALAGVASGLTLTSDIGPILFSAREFIVSRIAAFATVLRPCLVRMVGEILVSPCSGMTTSIVCHVCNEAPEDMIRYLSLIQAVKADLDFSPELVSASIDFVIRQVLGDTVSAVAIPYEAVAGARRVIGPSNDGIKAAMTEAVADMRERQYMAPSAYMSKLFACVVFGDLLEPHQLASVLDLTNPDLLPIMEKLVDMCGLTESTITRYSAVMAEAVSKPPAALEDSDVIALTLTVVYLSKCPRLDSTLFNDLLTYSPRRVSESCMSGLNVVDIADPSFIRMNTRDEVNDVFHRFRFILLSKMVSGTSPIVPTDVLIDQVSMCSSACIVQLNRLISTLLENGRIEDPSEFLIQYCNACFHFISNRNSDLVSEASVQSVLDIAIGCPATSPDVVPSRCDLMRKLMKIGEQSSPMIGRASVTVFIAFFKSLSATTNIPQELVDVIADLMVFKEAFDENEIEGLEFGLNKVWSVKQYGQYLTALQRDFESTSAYSRIATLVAVKECNTPEMIKAVVRNLLAKVRTLQEEMERKKAPQTPLPFTAFHRTQLRVYQALAFLAPLVDYPTFIDVLEPGLFGPLLRWANQPDCRDYLEVCAIYFLKKFNHPLDKLIDTLRDFSLSSQSVASFILVGGYIACEPIAVDSPCNVATRRDLIEALLPYLSSNISYIRGISQQWLVTAESRGVIAALDMARYSHITGFLSFVKTNKECVQFRRKLTPIYALWDPIGAIESGEVLSLCTSAAMYRNSELVPASVFINAVKEGIHDGMADNWFHTRDLETVINDHRNTRVASPHTPATEEGPNSQRKYCPQIGSIFPNYDESTQSRRSATELIVVTSLVDKVTNIAGLTRSAEVFGAAKLVVPSINVLREAQFSTMSVTAEQWIDIEEVAPGDLHEYLATVKRNGYTVVCLEQTHNSVQIDQYAFPSKTCLVLGNEKSGVEVGYLPLMDVCVEIPQRGIIRSLNVHVSGAIAMWQYNISNM